MADGRTRTAPPSCRADENSAKTTLTEQAVDLLREWLTCDQYRHDWIDFEERVRDFLAEYAKESMQRA